MYIPWAGFYSIEKYSRFTRKLLILLVSMEGIEPPTRGFSGFFRGFEGFINQPLAASCRPLPRPTKAQSWHTQSELVTFLARDKSNSYSGQWRSPLTGGKGVRAAERLSKSVGRAAADVGCAARKPRVDPSVVTVGFS